MDEVLRAFLSLAQRELSAEDVRLIGADEAPPEASNVVVARLRDGRHVVASFGSAPKDAAVLLRRLSMLASTFADTLEPPIGEPTRSRPTVWTSLYEELKALKDRTSAVDVVVIDGDSPVVWGSGSFAARPRARNALLLRDVSDRELSAQDSPSSPTGLRAVPASDDSGPLPDPTAPTGNLRVAPPAAESSRWPVSDGRASHHEYHERADDGAHELAHGHDHATGHQEPEITRRAIASIRALSSLALLHKGRHVREVSREGSSYLVLSFSGIYLLCLVFEGGFDELRAERAAQEALPRIDRLVLALPPLDPDPQPTGGVVALRRPRRR